MSIATASPSPSAVFMLDSPRTGRVLPSGRNPLIVDVQAVAEVDWLSGCSMSFRRAVFETFSFNEQFNGYGLGEDVDLSYRVRQQGRLLVTPEARIEHLQSPVNRIETPQYTYDEIVNRARRVRARTGCLRMRWFWWSVTGQLLALGGAAALDRSSVRRATPQGARGRSGGTARRRRDVTLSVFGTKPRVGRSRLRTRNHLYRTLREHLSGASS